MGQGVTEGGKTILIEKLLFLKHGPINVPELFWSGRAWGGLGWSERFWNGLGWFGVVWDGLGWFGVVWGGLGWFGVVWGGLGWFGVVWDFRNGLGCRLGQGVAEGGKTFLIQNFCS